MRLRLMLPAAGFMTVLSTAPSLAAPVVVTCGPGQHAIVRDGFADGAPVTRVACAGEPRYYASRAYYPARSDYPARSYYSARPYYRPHRSWGKSALIIGGSAGTGAGIGGLLGGKKGALAGAAIGGGAAGLYEGAHRR